MDGPQSIAPSAARDAAAAKVVAILRGDRLRWRLLAVVGALDLPDCWIGAGFVRNAVWDHLHGRAPSPLNGDVDVIWYDADRTGADEDRRLEAALSRVEPSVAWSVKNQARMHLRNADRPYASSTDAMRHWPETATAVAARRRHGDRCEVAAPLGFDDLFGLVLRPTLRFAGGKRPVFEERIRTKAWRTRWPMLQDA